MFFDKSKLNKKRKGFTLIELMVVMTISAILIYAMGGGILTLQVAVKLDNSIRDLKSFIQTTQIQARNSFVTYNRKDSASIGNSFFVGGAQANNISLGWMVSFSNQGSNALIVRNSVFFKPPTNYDFDRLKDEVTTFRNRLQTNLQNNIKYTCNNGVFQINGVTQSAYASVVTGISLAINCASNSVVFAESEYFQDQLIGAKMSTDFGTNALPSCWENGGTTSQTSLFFTSGYGDPVVRVDTAVGLRDCQLQIQHQGIINMDTRAIRVSKDNGLVEICGSYCTN
jgi:prepilin-type N-terminal cleavage/methylation domain-containing protein